MSELKYMAEVGGQDGTKMSQPVLVFDHAGRKLVQKRALPFL